MRLSAYFICMCLATIGAWANQPPAKFGKIDDADLKMTRYPSDPDAEAVILLDYATASFNQYLGVDIDRHVRIKILKPSGIRHGQVAIPFRYYHEAKEKVTYLRGFTHNWAGNKAHRSKLKPSEIIERNLDQENKQMMVTMPDVRVGSIVEYRYKITTIPEWFPHWKFQNALPTRHSEFRATIPEPYRYVDLSQGNAEFDTHEVEDARITIVEDKEMDTGTRELLAARETTRVKGTVLRGKRHRWICQDLPAFPDEPYAAPLENHIPKVRFQLQEIRNQDEAPVNLIGSWDDLRRKLLLAGHLGAQLSKDQKEFTELAIKWVGDRADYEERILTVYSNLTKKVSWNGQKGIRASKNLMQVLESGVGNAVDLNLTLVALLRAAGLDAYPILLSTRDHGSVQSLYPFKEQFNYVVALVKTGERGFLLDATEPLMPAGTLPIHALNGDGWMISQDFGGWVNLVSHLESERVMLTAQLSPNGNFEGKISLRDKGYTGLELRKKMIYGMEEPESWLHLPEGATIGEYVLEGQEQTDAVLVRDVPIQFTLEGQGSTLRFKPVIAGDFLENPFTNDERLLPIDFIFPREWSYTASIQLPEGYQLSGIPKPKAISAPDKTLVFRRNATVHNGTFTLMASLKINHTYFEKESYPGLRQFFDVVAQTLGEELELKQL